MLNVAAPIQLASGQVRHVRSSELDGVRLVEMPWQLQPDHPAVMAYPRAPRDMANVELQRLYALGIDALRVAAEIAAQRDQFELDGVTGRLQYDRAIDATRIERQAVVAEYRGGLPVPLGAAQAVVR
jgi:hypothetical protein